jgi:hypothetical protein
MTSSAAEKHGATVMAAYRNVGAGHRPDHATGALLLPAWTVMTVGAISNWLRRQRPGPRPVAAADRRMNEPARASDVAAAVQGTGCARAYRQRARVPARSMLLPIEERMEDLVSQGRS